ncbi:MAG TPA: FecR domain-containing protein [Gemmatimonadaceae bacterium]
MTPIRRPAPEPQTDALLRYISGASPLAEASAVQAWAAADPDREATIEELRSAWSLDASAPVWDRDAVWKRLEGETSKPDVARATRAGSITSDPSRRPGRYSRAATPGMRYLAAAAIVVMVASLAITSPWKRVPVPEPSALTAREVVTHRGQRAVLDLADGSRVTLAADSKLTIPSDFDAPDSRGRYRRQVSLEGRAYFDVVHDTSKPFVVRTASAVTRDIGTSFVLTAYPETHLTQVVVVKGSVGLWEPASARTPSTARPASPLMVLRRGDVATLDTDGTATRIRASKLAAYTSWMEGVLVFDHTPVREAVRELDRWYDLDIRVSDTALLGKHVSATISAETASQAMQHLAVALGADMQKTGSIVRLVPRGVSGR